MKTYLVKKIFATIQGEGFHAGRAAIFIRMVSCNLWSGQDRHRERDAMRNGAHCPLWCDTDFTTSKGAFYINYLLDITFSTICFRIDQGEAA